MYLYIIIYIYIRSILVKNVGRCISQESMGDFNEGVATDLLRHVHADVFKPRTGGTRLAKPTAHQMWVSPVVS